MSILRFDQVLVLFNRTKTQPEMEVFYVKKAFCLFKINFTTPIKPLHSIYASLHKAILLLSRFIIQYFLAPTQVYNIQNQNANRLPLHLDSIIINLLKFLKRIFSPSLFSKDMANINLELYLSLFFKYFQNSFHSCKFIPYIY